MTEICISYRRADSQAITGRIFDRLIANYGKDSIFIDIDNIPAGTDFRQYLAETLLKASVLLAVVGPKWLGAGKSGPDRIHDEADPVRVEVETALRNGLAIIPVLIGSRKMPNPSQLPESLKEFVYLNAVTIDPGVDFDHHMQRLITNIDAILAIKRKARAPAQSVSARRSTTQVRPSRVSGQHSSRPAPITSDSRERRILAAGASPRPAESAKSSSGTEGSKPKHTGFLAGLPPRMRIPLIAGATVVGLALLTFALFALNTADKGPGSASASSAAQAEGANKRASGKCSVEGFSLDLRNCR
jgi:hypothetical protein